METPITQFHVTDTIWRYAKSDNIGDDRLGVVGLTSVDVTCNNCGATWRAVESRESRKGRFRSYVGAVTLQCVGCDSEETISLRVLSKSFPWREL